MKKCYFIQPTILETQSLGVQQNRGISKNFEATQKIWREAYQSEPIQISLSPHCATRLGSPSTNYRGTHSTMQHRYKQRVRKPQQASNTKLLSWTILAMMIDVCQRTPRKQAPQSRGRLARLSRHANFISAAVQMPQTMQTAQTHRKKDEKFPG